MTGAASRRRRAALLAAALFAGAAPAGAQLRLEPSSSAFWWGAGAAVAAAAALDEGAQRASVAHRSRDLDRLANVGDALGTGRNLLVGMGATYVGARLAQRRGLASAVTHVAASYAAANVVASALKPAVGRHRPRGTDDPHDFRPLSGGGEWHSFPSGHTIHAFSIADALAVESGDARVAAAGYGVAAVVAWSRVYDDEHWLSDTAAGAVLGVAATRTTLHWLHARGAAHGSADSTSRGARHAARYDAPRVTILASPAALGVSIGY